MSTFDITKLQISTILAEILDGRLQLPEFQRGWVWNDEHIRALLVSIARGFPIGTVMLLEAGGKARFKARALEGVEPPKHATVESLILDGQQRLTTLTQVLKLDTPILTSTAKKREVHYYYYFDIKKALLGPEHIQDSIIAVDEKRMRLGFQRQVEIDLSSTEKEIEAFCFPCNQIFRSGPWERRLSAYCDKENCDEKWEQYLEFRQTILESFRSSELPVIKLNKHTSREGVCVVFEKVNTLGVKLTTFDLLTASWAEDGFSLRDDWLGTRRSKGGRSARLCKRPLLAGMEPTDFMQGLSLLHSFDIRRKSIEAGRTGREIAGVTAKREHVLKLELEAFKTWADDLTEGFELADDFLQSEGFRDPRFLPYRTQVTPLAVVLALIKTRWSEPDIKKRLTRWFWCGVFGETYNGPVDNAIADDVRDLLDGWLLDQPVSGKPAQEPRTIQSASFNPHRLDTLRTRTSAAYRGLYVLIQREGARDFFWKRKLTDVDRNDARIDIRHIFPGQWCKKAGINSQRYNSVVNKTAASHDASRIIGNKAPSDYIKAIQDNQHVKLTDAEMDKILATHAINPRDLRANDFDAFYESRKAALLALIEKTMGKASSETAEMPDEDDDEADDDFSAEARTVPLPWLT